MMNNGKGTGPKAVFDGERNGRYGRQGAREGNDEETPQGNRIGRGEGAVGGQGRGGEDGGVKWITL